MLGVNRSIWEKGGAIYTASEIAQQPDTWKKTINQIRAERDDLAVFISQVCSEPDYDIIMTGAGTSEYVGNSLLSAVAADYGFKIRSLGTTDIVAAPEKYLSTRKPTLLISFARSGNSPESLATVQLADQLCGNIRHLFITCNEDGALAGAAKSRANCRCVVLTPETNDKGFAMTSSFTNMYLAALCALKLGCLDEIEKKLEKLDAAARRCLDGSAFFQNIIDEFDYDRIVYLGAAELQGIAQEGALKTLELTGGAVAAFHGSPLGFRHGPKSLINEHTLTVIYLSDDPYARQYETDLINEMCRQRKGNRILAITNRADQEIAGLCDYSFSFQAGQDLPSSLLGLAYILPAQLIALFKSQRLGIGTDDPCPTGEVNRVVKNVTIHPYEPEKN